jgi:hypothetical protein
MLTLTPDSAGEPLRPLSLDETATFSAPPPAAQPSVVHAYPSESSSLAFEEELLAPPPEPTLAPSPAPSPAPEISRKDVGSQKPPSNSGLSLTPAEAPTTAPVPTPAAVSAAPPAAPTASSAAGAAASAPMDRDFIARNQVVERYLSGRLPLKGATEFERFCRDNPQILDELGLADRVNAGLRLLEASGKPEPWQEAKQPFWQKIQFTIGLAAAVVVLTGVLWYSLSDGATKTQRINKLESQAAERPLDPATSTREIRLLPSREGGSNTPAITIGGGAAQLVDFKIDESRSPYKVFRVTIDRIDQGRVAVISELAKDSNGHLRIALNSSALGPGNYQLTIEGITWRGDAEPDSWVTIGIQR